jgi:hypothetical protein
MPFKKTDYSQAGGSGGYIYVNTFNLKSNNEFGKKFTIEAMGGYGS